MIRPSRLVCLMLLLVLGLPARAGELEVDLLGWRLFQVDHGVRAALGEPFHTRRHEGWTDRAYLTGAS